MVSVVIPTCDRPELLDAALRSVAAQQVDGGVEAIVVNDGGVSVAPVLRTQADALPVKLIELGRRCGPAVARNIGIGHADGHYIAFLDDDDLFMPGHLATGCQPLECGEADFVYLAAVVADQRLCGPPTDLSSFRLKAYSYDHRFLMVANFLHTGSVIARNFRDSQVRFDETLNVCEDWDLWLALINTLGYRVRYIDKVTTVYHQVPEAAGLVAEAQQVSPSPFATAREYIQTKWRTADPLVLVYRQWMTALERVRSDLIASEQRMPNLLFDDILKYLHGRVSRERPPEYADIEQFFASSTGT